MFWLLAYLTAAKFAGAFPTTNDLIGYVATSLVVTVILFPTAWLLWYALPCKVSADGLACPNAFGKMVSVKWGDITAVRSFWFPGLPYLVVRTSGSRWRLWVPLFLGRLDEFTEQVGRFAGPDHVLYQALWPRVETNR